MRTKLALAFYYISIATIVLSALGIIWRFIIFPPCTQIGNNCILQPWDISGFAGTVLGISATMVGILGALAVAAWWTSLNNQVTEQVKKLYNKQKEDIDKLLSTQSQQLEDNIRNSQAKVDQLEQLMDDTEEILVDSFVAMGDLFSSKAADQAISRNRFWRFPYAMVKGYTQQIEFQMKKVEEVSSEAEQINRINGLSIPETVKKGLYWLDIAQKNREKATSFTQIEIKIIEEKFEDIKMRVDKIQKTI